MSTIPNVVWNKNYNIRLALDMAALAEAAYSQGNDLKNKLQNLGWTPLTPSSFHEAFFQPDEGGGISAAPVSSGVNNAYAFSAHRVVDGVQQFAISFRGTSDGTDWLNNLGEYGFSEYYQSLRNLVAETVYQVDKLKEQGEKVEILVTGHSLGGAAAQAAVLDMIMPKTDAIWTKSDAPLGIGNRLYDVIEQNLGRIIDESTIRDSLTSYVFGSPSIAMDAIKFTTGDVLGAYSTGVLLTIISNIAQSTAYHLNNESLVGQYLSTKLFQFEHEDSTVLGAGDPVAHISGSDGSHVQDWGSVINLDLATDIHERYSRLASFPTMHSMTGYQETLIRVIAQYEALRSGTYTDSQPLPATVIGNVGTSNNDVLSGNGNAPLYGLAGNDVLLGANGNNTLIGGDGDDVYVVWPIGNTTTIESKLDDSGSDILFIGDNYKSIDFDFNTEGDLTLHITSDNGFNTVSDVIIKGWYTTNRSDIGAIYGLKGSPYADGAMLSPQIFLNNPSASHSLQAEFKIPNLIQSTTGDDHIWGTFDGGEIIHGDLGDDWINGKAGNELIYGDEGNDHLFGDDGNDSLYGGNGIDTLNGGVGDDILLGENDNDTLYGGSGNDYLDGGTGSDELHGGAGDDLLTSNDGDALYGEAGNDTYHLGRGNYVLGDTQAAGESWENNRYVFHAAGVSYENTRFYRDGDNLQVVFSDYSFNSLGSMTIAGYGNQKVAEGLFIYNTDGVPNNSSYLGGFNLATVWSVISSADDIPDKNAAVDGRFSVLPSDAGSIGIGAPRPLFSDGDDIVEGTDGDDIIIALGGNDWINGKGGSDYIDTGSGNDIIRGMTYGTVDGGVGEDELVADLSGHSVAYYHRNLVYWRVDGAGSQTNTVGAGSSLADVQSYVAAGGTNYLGTQHGELLLSYTNIEKVSLTGLNFDPAFGDGGNDLLIAVGQGGKYVGGQGTDTLYADWSNSTVSALFDSSVADEQVINGVTVSGIERMLVKLGSGADVLNLSTSGSHEVWAGDGNNRITLSSGNVYSGMGDDWITNGSGTVDTGSGNDIIRGMTYGTVDGGVGEDELVADLSGHSVAYYHRNLVYWRVDGAGSQTNTVGAGSSLADVQSYVAAGGTNYLGTQHGELLLSYTNIEKVSLTGLNFDPAFGDGGNDLLIAVGQGGKYVGGQGTDTLYADWSATSSSIVWQNTDIETNVNGTIISGIERLLLETGSGNDFIDNTANFTSDEIRTGAGNDTINGGSGADTLIGGTGDDLYIVDDINDIVIENTNAGTDTVQSMISYTLTDNTENLVLTGTDALNGTGNSLNNILIGNNANNYLLGGLGDDTLIANNGDDSLEGEAGNDLLIGGSGTDTYFFNRNAGATGQDTIDDTDGLSTITITGTTLAQLTATQQANDLILAIQNSTDTITIKNFFDVANTADYQLSLNDGLVDKAGILKLLPVVHVVTGTTGSDVLQGGTENDTYIVNNARDFIKEPTGNSSIDTVQASVSYALLPSLENLTLTGAANLSGIGNTADNIIKGNEGNNRLLGGAGNDTLYGLSGGDTLNGGDGADLMLGGAGNDTYTVNHINDVVTELTDVGYDSVNSFISYTLTANVERLNLEGLESLNGTGNDLDNTLNGNNANNSLVGGAGNDTLQGKGGADTLEGGLGNDTYYVDNVGDVVTELASEGTDKVTSSISYTLTAHVEQLFLTGIAGLKGTGNSQNNIIYGNSGNNQLFGDVGNDSLNGGAGNDILDGGLGLDTLVGGAGNDTYVLGINSNRDIINNNDATGNDKLLFDAGINADQVWLRQLGNDLEVSIMGTANSAKVQNWYSNTANQLDSLQLADGKTLLANEVQTLVEAMAAFAVPALGQTNLTTAQHTALDSVIVASW